MSTIVTRAAKGSPLTNAEVDSNFTNLNTDKAELSGAVFTGAITTNSTFDGRDVATDGTKLDGIEASATADQTGAQIKTAYEAETNAFTDAQFTKLAGIEASADVTDTTNVTAAGALMDSELTSIASVKALNQGVATTDSPTFAGLVATTADINAGTIDGTVIGASSASTGAFTTLSATGVLTANAGVVVDTITIDGSTITSSGSLTLDLVGNLTIDVDGTVVSLSDGGVNFGQLFNSGSGNFNIYSPVSNQDMIFRGNDGGTGITALTLDMSTAGAATYNSTITTGGGGQSGKIAIVGNTTSSEGTSITFTNTQGAKTFAVGGGQSGVTNNGFVIRNVTDNTFPLVISDAGAATFSGNVGIGVSSPNESLSVADSIVSGDLADSTTTVYRLEPADTNFTRQLTISDRVGATAGAEKGNAIIFSSKYTGDTQQGMAGIVGISESISGNQKGALAFLTRAHDENPNEKMRIDSSGNVLVGKDASNSTAAGSQLNANGLIIGTTSATNPLLLNRLSTDGDISVFQKAGTTVGSIQSRAGVVSTIILDPRTNGVGLTGTATAVIPTSNTGVLSNAVMDIGGNGYAFKDAYLSGGVVFGPASASNVSSQTLDSYEEGTWTVTVTTYGGSITVDTATHTCSYTKIGRVVNIWGNFGISAISSPTGDFMINGLPFAHNAGAAGYGGGSVAVKNLVSTVAGYASGFITGSPSKLYVRGGYSTSAEDSNMANKFDTGSSVKFQCSYYV